MGELVLGDVVGGAGPEGVDGGRGVIGLGKVEERDVGAFLLGEGEGGVALEAGDLGVREDQVGLEALELRHEGLGAGDAARRALQLFGLEGREHVGLSVGIVVQKQDAEVFVHGARSLAPHASPRASGRPRQRVPHDRRIFNGPMKQNVGFQKPI